MRTAVGIIIADHLPGMKTHRLNAAVLTLSRIAEPADLIGVIRLTRLVFKSISSGLKIDAPQGGFIDSLVTFLSTPNWAPGKSFAFDEITFETDSARVDARLGRSDRAARNCA
jgi:hypothetical protein